MLSRRSPYAGRFFRSSPLTEVALLQLWREMTMKLLICCVICHLERLSHTQKGVNMSRGIQAHLNSLNICELPKKIRCKKYHHAIPAPEALEMQIKGCSPCSYLSYGFPGTPCLLSLSSVWTLEGGYVQSTLCSPRSWRSSKGSTTQVIRKISITWSIT